MSYVHVYVDRITTVQSSTDLTHLMHVCLSIIAFIPIFGHYVQVHTYQVNRKTAITNTYLSIRSQVLTPQSSRSHSSHHYKYKSETEVQSRSWEKKLNMPQMCLFWWPKQVCSSEDCSSTAGSGGGHCRLVRKFKKLFSSKKVRAPTTFCCQYDPLSYAKNFDRSSDLYQHEEDGDKDWEQFYYTRFSSRFVSNACAPVID